MGVPDGKRLVFDIEVSPAIYWLWKGGYGINVPTGNLLQEAKVICISYQFEGEKIKHLQWDKNQCDKAMLEAFIPIMQEAEVLIGHNSDNFDIKWLRTRCLFHRLPCPPDFVTIDTWKQAKKYFRFQGNGLKYISKFLGLEGKIEPPHDLWSKVVFNKDSKAMKEMLKYCDRDVDQTTKVFKEFSPYTHATAHRGHTMQSCPHCGGTNTKKKQERITAKGTKTVQFQCADCGKHGAVAATKWYTNKVI